MNCVSGKCWWPLTPSRAAGGGLTALQQLEHSVRSVLFLCFQCISPFFFFYLIGRGQIPVALWNPEFVSKAVKIRAPFVIEGFFFFSPLKLQITQSRIDLFFFSFFLSLLSFDSNAKWLSSWDFAQLFLSTSRHRSHRGIIAWHLGVNPFETAADYS